MPKLPDLMGAGEVAEAIGVDRRNLYRQSGLPEPAHRLSNGSVWTRKQIEDWIKDRRKRGVQQ